MILTSRKGILLFCSNWRLNLSDTLNSLTPLIKFTLEVEQNNKIPFKVKIRREDELLKTKVQ